MVTSEPFQVGEKLSAAKLNSIVADLQTVKRKSELQRQWHIGVGTATILFVWFLYCLAFAWFESQAYERLTGKQVSTWDAMFIELRVDSPPKPDAREAGIKAALEYADKHERNQNDREQTE